MPAEARSAPARSADAPSAGAASARVPHGTLERLLRVVSALFVLSIGVALLLLPGPKEGTTTDGPWPIDPRAARITAGAVLIVLLVTLELLARRRR